MENEEFESNPLYKDVKSYLSQPTTQKNQKPKIVGKYKFILPGVVIVLVLVILIAVLLNFRSVPILSSIFAPAGNPLPQKVSLVELEPDNPFFTSVAVRYIGKILEVSNNPGGLKLITNIENAPEVLITPETSIAFQLGKGRNAIKSAATMQDIAVGQDIAVRMVFRLQTKLWVVEDLTIYR